MMNIPEMDKTVLEWLAAAYETACDQLMADPVTAEPAEQRRVRKWLMRLYINNLPEDVQPYVKKSVPDGAFFAFLKACSEQHEILQEAERQQDEQVLNGLPQDAGEMLRQWVRGEMEDQGQLCCDGGHTLYVRTEVGCGAFVRRLVLEQVQGLPGKPYCLEEMVLEGTMHRGENGEIVLPYHIESADSDETIACEMRFSGATVENIVYRGDPANGFGSPWERLCSLAGAVVEKYNLIPDTLNDKERALLPLLAELAAFSTVSQIPAELRYGFSRWIALAEETGSEKAVRMLKAFHAEWKHPDWRKMSALMKELNHIRNKALWERISAMLADSQAGYPALHEVVPAPAEMDAYRAKITEILHAHGYAGTYPDFEKRGPACRTCVMSKMLSGWQNPGSCDRLIFRGQPGIYRIQCREDFSGGVPWVRFHCLTTFPKKGQPEQDALTCMFENDGRSMMGQTYWTPDDEGDAMVSLENAVLEAMLTAEKRRPTNAQRKQLGMPSRTEELRFVLLLSLVLGVLFGILFTPAMAVATALIDFIAGTGTFLSLLADFPWIGTLVFSIVGTSVPLTVILWYYLT